MPDNRRDVRRGPQALEISFDTQKSLCRGKLIFLTVITHMEADRHAPFYCLVQGIKTLVIDIYSLNIGMDLKAAKPHVFDLVRECGHILGILMDAGEGKHTEGIGRIGAASLGEIFIDVSHLLFVGGNTKQKTACDVRGVRMLCDILKRTLGLADKIIEMIQVDHGLFGNGFGVNMSVNIEDFVHFCFLFC